MEGVELERFSRAIHRPNGAVLVTGPTGSGKSTTLYAARFRAGDSITAETDPHSPTARARVAIAATSPAA